MNFQAELWKYLTHRQQTTDADLSEFITEIIAPHQADLPILYRFSPADYNNIRGLETQTLFLSDMGTMNDIFEGLSCPITDDVISSIEKLSDIAFLKSFTETKDDLKMWSMYADNYQGMCVAYDFRQCDYAYMYHLFPVCYSNNRKNKQNLEDAAYQLEKLKRDIAEQNAPDEYESICDIMSLFLIKSPEWQNEREWRIVVTYPQMFLHSTNISPDEIPLFYDISDRTIQVPYATDVYLGPKMPERIKEHIKEIALKNHLKVHEMQMDSKRYVLTEKESPK